MIGVAAVCSVCRVPLSPVSLPGLLDCCLYACQCLTASLALGWRLSRASVVANTHLTRQHAAHVAVLARAFFNPMCFFSGLLSRRQAPLCWTDMCAQAHVSAAHSTPATFVQGVLLLVDVTFRVSCACVHVCICVMVCQPAELISTCFAARNPWPLHHHGLQSCVSVAMGVSRHVIRLSCRVCVVLRIRGLCLCCELCVSYQAHAGWMWAGLARRVFFGNSVYAHLVCLDLVPAWLLLSLLFLKDAGHI